MRPFLVVLLLLLSPGATAAPPLDSSRPALASPGPSDPALSPLTLAVSLAGVAGLGLVVPRIRNVRRKIRARTLGLERELPGMASPERMYEALATSQSDMVTLHQADGTLLYASPSTLELTGYAPKHLLGRRIAEFLLPEDRPKVTRVGEGSKASVRRRGTVRFQRRSGEFRSFDYVAQAFGGGGEGEFVVAWHDVTQRADIDAALEEAHNRYWHLARHDPGPGLPNRAALSIRLNEAARRARANRTGLSVLILNLDNFRSINDAFGLAGGDEVLGLMAARLQLATRGLCELAPLGGDEFIALVPHEDPVQIEALASCLVEACARPVEFRDRVAHLSGSVGIAQYRRARLKPEGLLDAADIALHAAKSAGKNAWRLYEAELGRGASRHAESLQSLRNAFERGEFALHYQPKVSLAGGEIVGYEALLRCRTPSGVRGAAGLLAAAEQSGFTAKLDEWVVRTAAAQSLEWRKAGIDVPIAVNVSTMQLHDRRLLGLVRELVARDPELPRFLVLELTESTLALEVDRALGTLAELSSIGLTIHIDDFGTGYSSLSRLARMPVAALKVDRSFVAGTPGNAESCEIVSAAVALAHALQLRVIAEGVETDEQMRFLRACGCDEAQGYFFDYPMPAEEVANRAKARSQALAEAAFSA